VPAPDAVRVRYRVSWRTAALFTKARSYKHLGGAVGLSLLSRLLGLFREILIVARLGVHEYTDAYFATSVIVLWLQNWSFGAWSLYFVPKYLSLPTKDRTAWFRRRFRLATLYSTAGATIFVVCYPAIESTMLGGRRVFGVGESLILGLALAATGVTGVLYGRLIAIPAGILLAARALLLANIAGVTTLVVFLTAPIPRSFVLPATLAVTQFATIGALVRFSRALKGDAEQSPVTGLISPSHAVATTVENVAFNSNAAVHQAIAGWLPLGSVTVNAYAMRLLLLPVTGLMTPVQQYMMQLFAMKSARTGFQTATRGVMAAMGLGLVAGLVAMGTTVLTLPLWPANVADMITEYRMPLLLCLYGAYAGVLFSNALMARWYFATGNGWSYAVVMIVAYTAGTTVKAFLAGPLGVPALPLGAIIGEGAAMMALVVRGSRLHSLAEPMPITRLGQ